MARSKEHAKLQRQMVAALKRAFLNILIADSGNGLHLAGGARAGRLRHLDGMLVGDPDFQVREWSSCGVMPTLYVEVKVTGGTCSPAQRATHDDLLKRGNAVVVVYTVQGCV